MRIQKYRSFYFKVNFSYEPLYPEGHRHKMNIIISDNKDFSNALEIEFCQCDLDVLKDAISRFEKFINNEGIESKDNEERQHNEMKYIG